MTANNILLARFTIDMPALAGQRVAVFTFPYKDLFDEFLAAMNEIKPRDNSDYEERLPFRRLNNVLVVTAPGLIHGFGEFGKKEQWARSGIWEKPRQMLMLATDLDGNPTWKPSISQINELVAVWAEQWAKKTFAEELSNPRMNGEEVLDTLYTGIMKTQAAWREIDAATLWEAHQADKLVWSALPSVVAAMFVNRTAHQPFRLGDHEIRWMLTQESNGKLAVVSEPNYFESSNKRDLISYKLEFVAQTQAQATQPWIAVYIRLRRWASRPISYTNFGNETSVMVCLGSARKQGWQITPTMVKLGIRRNRDGYYWVADTPELLQEWKARDLPNADDLFKNPHKYAREDKHKDRYFVLHASGMKYGKRDDHHAKTGTSLRERREIMTHIGEVMGAHPAQNLPRILQSDTALPLDDGGVLSREDLYKHQLWALYSRDDMKETNAFPQEHLPPATPTHKRVPQRRRLLQHGLVSAALDRARGEKPLHFLLITKESPAQIVLEREIRKLLFVENGEKLPEHVQITAVTLPLELSTPLGDSIPYPISNRDKKTYRATLTAEWQTSVKAWEAFLQNNINPHAHNLAIIELDGYAGERDEAYRNRGWLIQAIRHACVKQGVLSQIVQTIPPKLVAPVPLVADLSRIQNAVADLVLRQTNVLYDAPSRVYEYAGLDKATAESLIIVGLYRFKRYESDPHIDYPLAVSLYPDGRVTVTLPDEDGNIGITCSYVEAVRHIGNIFTKPMTKATKRLIDYDDKHNSRLKRFAENILTHPRTQPTLILMDADDWRGYNVFLPIGNERIKKNHLVLGDHAYTPATLPHVRLLRIREAGSLGETPQYVATNNQDWLQLDDEGKLNVLAGMRDVNALSPMFHYFSIGQHAKSDDDKDQLYAFDNGGVTKHQYRQAIELVPFFLQEGDAPQAYCRIAHFLRSSPGWTQGNIVFPYPLHLAKTLLDDLEDVLQPKLKL